MNRTIAKLIPPTEVSVRGYLYPARAIAVAVLVGAILGILVAVAFANGIDAANL